MEPIDRLRQGVERMGLEVSGEAAAQLLWYLEEMQRWNRRINLTAIRDPGEGVEKHLLDALTPLFLLREEERLLDLGSGPGLPGIALKIVRPVLRVMSVESVGKKAIFQRHVVRTLSLRGFEVWADRAENLPRKEAMAGSFSVGISRAFSSLADFVSLALPCLAPQGRLIAMKGAEGERELDREASELQRLGVVIREVHSLRLPFSGAARTLIVLSR